jgi:hypothetical protein
MEESNELRDLVLRCYEIMSSGDLRAWVERYISRTEEMLYLGTDPDEWWEGYDTYMQVVEELPEEWSAFSIVAGDLQAYCEGTVGWVADRPKMVMSDGTELAPRLTAVFRKEDGDWKGIQWHWSIGVPNEQVME